MKWPISRILNVPQPNIGQAPEDLPAYLRDEYALLYEKWYVAYRACYGLFGVDHPGALESETRAWNQIVFFCSEKNYQHPPLHILRDQIQAEDAAFAA